MLRRLVLVGVVAGIMGGPIALAGDGAASFTQNCQMCHQAGGVGLAGAFPRLAGRVAALSAKPSGRAYIIDVLTYGMAGTVTVDKQPIMGLMPPFAQLPDDEVASILSYVQTLGDPPAKAPAPFTAEEITAARAKSRKGPSDVLAERQGLDRARLLP
jgi:mono/diheme cytochrome c family protein